MGDDLSDFFDETEDIFSIFETLEGASDFPPLTALEQENTPAGLASQKSACSSFLQEWENELAPCSQKCKRLKRMGETEEVNTDGQQRISHITVERNRRKQMNEHLSVLRSLMPCFYVKRGDQASIIGGVVDYINELQTVLQSLEAKKQRKVYSEVLSPRLVSSPRTLALSPRKPPLSPRVSLPISPRTPQPGSPYKPRLQQGYLSPSMATSSLELSPVSSTSSIDNNNELVANSKSTIADVEVKFSGPNLILKTISPQIPGQVMKIISTLEELSLEILEISINTVEEAMLNAFTIKIGIECQLSAEELAHQIQKTFS